MKKKEFFTINNESLNYIIHSDSTNYGKNYVALSGYKILKISYYLIKDQKYCPKNMYAIPKHN